LIDLMTMTLMATTSQVHERQQVVWRPVIGYARAEAEEGLAAEGIMAD
jgi:hypothetical protein